MTDADRPDDDPTRDDLPSAGHEPTPNQDQAPIPAVRPTRPAAPEAGTDPAEPGPRPADPGTAPGTPGPRLADPGTTPGTRGPRPADPGTTPGTREGLDVGDGPTVPMTRPHRAGPPTDRPDRAPAGPTLGDDEPTVVTPPLAGRPDRPSAGPKAGPILGGDEPTLVTPPAAARAERAERDLGGETVPLHPSRPAAPASERDPGGRTVRLPPPGPSPHESRAPQQDVPAGRANWDTGTAAWDFLAVEHDQAEPDRPRHERRTAESDQGGPADAVRKEAGRQQTRPEQAGRELGEGEPTPGEQPGRAATGSPEPVIAGAGGDSGDSGDAVPVRKKGVGRKVSSASALIGVLLALFGFTLVVQLRSNDTDQGLATARQEDLVRILSDLEARDTRLSGEISALEQSQRQLTSGVAGRQAALAEADKRADELGLLAGTLPGRGPGLKIVVDPKSGQVKASAVLNAVQELRGAGGEVMELVGADGTAVRIVASTYFVDAGGGGIVADGAKLTGPYTLWVIGQPQTMQTALQIPGGVVASVESAGGSVTMEQSSLVEVAAVRKATDLQYARPVS
jgi:uncharacterized protein YlxW (UPF0749 family)